MMIDRRDFLRLSVATLGAAALESCASVTTRYTRPKSLVRTEDKLLLTNVSVVDVNKGILLPGMQVLLQKGRIAAILRMDAGAGITPDRTIDLGNAYLLPGLINAHCHLSFPAGFGTNMGFLSAVKRQGERNAEECIKHGVTTVRDMMTSFGLLGSLREKIAEGEVVGPRIVNSCCLQVSGGYLRQGGIFTSKNDWITVNDLKGARKAMRRIVEKGIPCVKLFQQPVELYMPGSKIPTMDVQTMRFICEEAHKHNLIVALHHTETQGFQKGLEACVTSFEHLACDREITDDELRKLQDTRAHVVPTISVAFSLSFERKGDPYWGKGRTPEIMEYRKAAMDPLMREFLEPEIYEASSKSFREYENPASYEKHHAFFWLDPTVFNAAGVVGDANLKKVVDAGIPMGCGNDGGVPFIYPGAMALEMSLLERIGLTPARILRDATLNNAAILKLQDRIGSVEEGKIADLMVVKQNPLETVQNLMKPDLVFQEGQAVYAAAPLPI